MLRPHTGDWAVGPPSTPPMLRAARLLCAAAPAVRAGLPAPVASGCSLACLDVRWGRWQSTLITVPVGGEAHPTTPDAVAGDAMTEHDNRVLVVRRTDAPPTRQHYKVEANYIGSSINVNALHARPEFQGCFSAKHRGALLLGPHQSNDPDTAEEEASRLPALAPADVVGSAGQGWFSMEARSLRRPATPSRCLSPWQQPGGRWSRPKNQTRSSECRASPTDRTWWLSPMAPWS